MLFFVAGIAFAEPRLVGVVSGLSDATEYLIKPSDDGAVRWLKLGDSIEGFRLTEYLESEETLIVENAGRKGRWKLKESKVVPAVTERAEKKASEIISLEAARKKLADAQERLAKLREERRQALEKHRASKSPPPQQK